MYSRSCHYRVIIIHVSILNMDRTGQGIDLMFIRDERVHNNRYGFHGPRVRTQDDPGQEGSQGQLRLASPSFAYPRTGQRGTVISAVSPGGALSVTVT